VKLIKAFTLIELLYVMAFTIVVVPVIGPLLVKLINLAAIYARNLQ
jgi:hypothetical protein